MRKTKKSREEKSSEQGKNQQQTQLTPHIDWLLTAFAVKFYRGSG